MGVVTSGIQLSCPPDPASHEFGDAFFSGKQRKSQGDLSPSSVRFACEIFTQLVEGVLEACGAYTLGCKLGLCYGQLEFEGGRRRGMSCFEGRDLVL